ncbi:hypothetical protein PYW07_014334 [Mythimna separata]|uniref:Uncharacterized protein n=1 Tax=Mythimna separata TaxID=271217 RepID=A0AAD7Z0D4_MYTSE|nr:hypothetical protein PYW07_014334 [Mythimna separata]
MLSPTTSTFSFLCIIVTALAEPKLIDNHEEDGPADDDCNNVCKDLPENDLEPVCMMFSRYKKGFQFFVNMCHARRAVCKENLMLHLVHPSRCKRSNQFFLPIV